MKTVRHGEILTLEVKYEDSSTWTTRTVEIRVCQGIIADIYSLNSLDNSVRWFS